MKAHNIRLGPIALKLNNDDSDEIVLSRGMLAKLVIAYGGSGGIGAAIATAIQGGF